MEKCSSFYISLLPSAFVEKTPKVAFGKLEAEGKTDFSRKEKECLC